MENVTVKYLRLFSVFILMSLPSILFSQVTGSKEYQIKAAFLFNFTQFIEWPDKTFPDANAPFVIGVLGQDPFGNYLDEIVSGEKIKGHSLAVTRFNSIDEVKNCQILFINPGKEDVSAVLKKLKVSNVLTVGDARDFTRQGGMIGFLTESRKIRIQINLEAAQESDLVVSSKLLRVAEIVSTEN
jgi:hypothetical protein